MMRCRQEDVQEMTGRLTSVRGFPKAANADQDRQAESAKPVIPAKAGIQGFESRTESPLSRG